LYYSGWHSWTQDVRQAFRFQKPEDAAERARGEQLNQVEVVIRSEDGNEKVVPVVERRM
jgi:hypothetical protein